VEAEGAVEAEVVEGVVVEDDKCLLLNSENIATVDE
jgi:hypothetical protein